MYIYTYWIASGLQHDTRGLSRQAAWKAQHATSIRSALRRTPSPNHTGMLIVIMYVPKYLHRTESYRHLFDAAAPGWLNGNP